MAVVALDDSKLFSTLELRNSDIDEEIEESPLIEGMLLPLDIENVLSLELLLNSPLRRLVSSLVVPPSLALDIIDIGLSALLEVVSMSWRPSLRSTYEGAYSKAERGMGRKVARVGFFIWL